MCKMAALIALLCGTLILGQETTSRSPSTLRVDVDLVLLEATVTDSADKYVSGLRPENFRVWEDKMEQRIEYFSADNVPLSAGIIFDTSGSMEHKLLAARAAANTFLRMGDRDDEYFLIQFSDSPHVLQDFTTDITKLQSGLLFTRAKGRTSLYDALYLGLEKVNRGRNKRKAVVLITDGEDNHSVYSFADVREYAKEHDVMIYSIGIIDDTDVQFSDGNGRSVLENLSELTGGAAFFPNSVDALEGICEQIGRELKNQYVLGYRSSNLSNDGRWRKIRVDVKAPQGMPRMRIRARTGYYAPMIGSAMK